MNRRWVPFVSGVLFALGLGLSRMTDPQRVIAFLDVSGAWDSSLGWVMVSAILVHLVGRRLVLGTGALDARSWRGERIELTAVVGAALFGVGWGLSGFCPGPAIAASASGGAGALITLGAMLVGIGLHDFRLIRRKSRDRSLTCGDADWA